LPADNSRASQPAPARTTGDVGPPVAEAEAAAVPEAEAEAAAVPEAEAEVVAVTEGDAAEAEAVAVSPAADAATAVNAMSFLMYTRSPIVGDGDVLTLDAPG
jgi:hypothetical protein